MSLGQTGLVPGTNWVPVFLNEEKKPELVPGQAGFVPGTNPGAVQKPTGPKSLCLLGANFGEGDATKDFSVKQRVFP